MPSNIPFYSLLLVVLLATLALFVSPTHLTPQQEQEHQNQKQKNSGFRVKLKQVDSGKNLTQFERIQDGIKRGQHRLQKITNRSSYHDLRAISSPVSPRDVSIFSIEFSIGTPRKTQSVLLDTGSDLLWIQCEPCINCYKQNNPIFYPNQSLSFINLSSSSELCKALPELVPTDEGCEYYYKYLKGSYTSGIMARENFTFGDVIVPNIGFGCGVDNEGRGFSPGSGIVGLGRGLLSLVSQLKETKFAYCLPSFDDPNNSGTLWIGSLERILIGELKTTPLIGNWFEPSHYYISLRGISIGGTKINIEKSIALKDDGTGGIFIDSGTPVTHLEENAYGLVRDEFIKKFKLSEDKSGLYVFDLCFNFPNEGLVKVEVPELIFHFHGADLYLPTKNYMIEDKKNRVMCLGIFPSKDLSMFGALQQQNVLVIHDLKEETLSFLPTECDQL
ncbi:Eukaryotic aspartyl protease family protein [Tripterygium wilfordii]|uniref:Eukaryotic aspartyl protease family protein n=1 Tax=Tripterygium wilfordii TaxID=458696 RepID=A0A7J7CJJ4_TRIWF|nr:aspartic proteinase nepenthesin-1-like [Tripterygium wilfordii]KAF5734214.1 Eukaryotic aspartyl protease family protein [Tripterygium wilfordii]